MNFFQSTALEFAIQWPGGWKGSQEKNIKDNINLPYNPWINFYSLVFGINANVNANYTVVNWH